MQIILSDFMTLDGVVQAPGVDRRGTRPASTGTAEGCR